MIVTHASFTIHCFSVVYSCLFNVIMCLTVHLPYQTMLLLLLLLLSHFSHV